MTEKQKIKLEMEKERIKGMRDFENGQIRQFLGLGDGCTFIAAGIDEAGRGPLAGPVAAGAVILPADHDILYLNDSKKRSALRHLPALMRSISCRRPMRRCALL
jgi:ribonuclease HII